MSEDQVLTYVNDLLTKEYIFPDDIYLYDELPIAVITFFDDSLAWQLRDRLKDTLEKKHFTFIKEKEESVGDLSSYTYFFLLPKNFFL